MFTDYLSENPVEKATTEDVYDQQYVLNILSAQAELNAKYGQLFVDQSQNAPERNKTRKKIQTIENLKGHSRITET